MITPQPSLPPQASQTQNQIQKKTNQIKTGSRAAAPHPLPAQKIRQKPNHRPTPSIRMNKTDQNRTTKTNHNQTVSMEAPSAMNESCTGILPFHLSSPQTSRRKPRRKARSRTARVPALVTYVRFERR